MPEAPLGFGAVLDPGSSSHTRAVRAAVEGAVRLHPVSNDPDAAELASRGERVYCTLEAVKHVRLIAGVLYSEGLVVLVAANFALSHLNHPLRH
jgi:hypothetical protein